MKRKVNISFNERIAEEEICSGGGNSDETSTSSSCKTEGAGKVEGLTSSGDSISKGCASRKSLLMNEGHHLGQNNPLVAPQGQRPQPFPTPPLGGGPDHILVGPSASGSSGPGNASHSSG